MNSWLRRIRGAVGMGLTWAAGWGSFFQVFDAPLPAFASHAGRTR